MKKLHISMAGKRAVNGYLFILPWLLGFLLFYVRSLYMTVEFSLSDLTVLSTGGYNLEFVGLKNYYEAFFSHASFKQTLTTSIGNMLIDVPLIIFFSLFVAMMLNRKMKCRGLPAPRFCPTNVVTAMPRLSIGSHTNASSLL